MRATWTIARREFAAYFSTMLGYVFLVVFLVAVGFTTFDAAGFLDRRQADLTSFFAFHDVLFLVLIPAVGMRLWAEERRSGTVELLMTLPVTPWQAVLGKFLAAWLFVGLALALTFPIWITVNYLGDPDNGVIVASYVASFLMAGTLLAATASVSALSKSQVVAFVFAAALGFLLWVSGLQTVQDFFSRWAPQYVVDLIASLSLSTHIAAISRGVLELDAIVFFIGLMVLFLFLNRQLVEVRKAS